MQMEPDTVMLNASLPKKFWWCRKGHSATGSGRFATGPPIVALLAVRRLPKCPCGVAARGISVSR